ncbi:MAG: hypothetical protein K6A28_01525, partial [Bacteroidales bacterium]|nr:hypothetical protein [Bacteroidales bacterium]
MVVQIDGEETANSNLELAGFIGDTLVSDGNFPSAVDSGDRFMYFVTLNGYDATNASNQSHWDELNFNHITFKLYDHAAEKEMTNCYTQIIYTSNGIFGNPTDPFEINFFSDEPQWELVTDPSVLKGGDNLLITNLANTLALSEVQNAKNRDSSPITVDSNGNITFVYPEPQSYDSTYYSEDDEEDVTETFWHYPPQIITLHEETEHLTMFVY